MQTFFLPKLKALRFTFILIFFLNFCLGQNTFKQHISNFNMMSFTYKHDNKWSFYVEIQQRSIDDYMLPDYYEVKGGPAYNFNKNNQVLLGFGRYGTYRDSKFYQREYRLWIQYVLSQKINRVKLDHRLRAEKRYFYFPMQDDESNDERYRYRLAVTVPINHEKMAPGTFFFNTFEEIFLGPKDPDTFKRNRFFSGFGYQFSPVVNSNIGYMWQKEYSAVRGDRNYHFVYFAVNFTFDRKKFYETDQIPMVD